MTPSVLPDDPAGILFSSVWKRAGGFFQTLDLSGLKELFVFQSTRF